MNAVSFLASRKTPAAHLFILIALAVTVLVLPAGMWDLRGPDEGRYTQIAKELLQKDNWFALTVMDQPYDQKPPLAFWLLALALKATGGEPVSWALRMPSVLAAIGMLILTYLLGRKFAGAPAGFLSGLFMVSSLTFLDDAPTVELNMLYAFFTTATLSVWLFNWEHDRLNWAKVAAFWLLLGGAFMVKGPLAILIVISSLGYTAWVRKSWQPFKAVGFLPGFVLLLAIIGGWFWAQSIAYGSDFVEKQVSGETLDRFLKGDHGRPFWYYFPRLFSAVLGPWAFFFIAAMVVLWRKRGRNFAFTAPLLGWVAIPFIILVLAHGKRVPYLLPLLPAACLLAGIYVTLHLAPYRMGAWYQRALIAGMSIVIALLTCFGFLFLNPEILMTLPKVSTNLDFTKLHPELWISAAIIVAILLYSYFGSRRTWAEGCWATGLTILIAHFLVFTSIHPAMEPTKSARHFTNKVDALMKSVGENTLLALPDLAEPEFHVYAHYNVTTGRKAEVDLESTTLPLVLALKDNEITTSGPAALAAGYKEVFDAMVTKRPVRVYLRTESTPTH